MYFSALHLSAGLPSVLASFCRKTGGRKIEGKKMNPPSPLSSRDDANATDPGVQAPKTPSGELQWHKAKRHKARLGFANLPYSAADFAYCGLHRATRAFMLCPANRGSPGNDRLRSAGQSETILAGRREDTAVPVLWMARTLARGCMSSDGAKAMRARLEAVNRRGPACHLRRSGDSSTWPGERSRR